MLLPTATIELIYKDASDNTSAVVVNLPISSSVTVMDATATALASLIAPMTNATLVKIRHVYKAKLEADIANAGSSPIVISGMFFFEDFDGGHIGVIQIPAFKDSLVLSTGFGASVTIDTDSDEVFDFVGGVVDADGCDPFGNLFFRLRTAYVQRRV